jgi:hypothetical protein
MYKNSVRERVVVRDHGAVTAVVNLLIICVRISSMRVLGECQPCERLERMSF